MELTSTAFDKGGAIPVQYSCQGEKVNPPLKLSGVPDGATALALTVDDPEVPSVPGGVFDHWVLWNLPPELSEIPEGWAPEAGVTVGANGSGEAVWYPLCPPSGMHHYYFRLYALDKPLDLAEGSTKAELLKAMEGHITAQTELMGTYTKQ